MNADTIVLDGELGLEDLSYTAEPEVAFTNIQGLDFEFGIVEVDEATLFPNLVIEFKNHHNKAPIVAAIVDATGTYDSTPDTLHSDIISYFGEAFGNVIYSNPETELVAVQHVLRRSTNENSLAGSSTVYHNRTPMIETTLTNEMFKPGVAGALFRPGRIYKWYAIWASIV